MSIQKLITLNILFSPGKPNNAHSSRWLKLEITNSLIFVQHLNQYFPNWFVLSHLGGNVGCHLHQSNSYKFFRFNFNVEEPFVTWKDPMYYSILKSLYFCFSTCVEWHLKNILIYYQLKKLNILCVLPVLFHPIKLYLTSLLTNDIVSFIKNEGMYRMLRENISCMLPLISVN